jgi:hypothetical protein
MISNSDTVNNIDTKYNGATQIQLPFGDFTKINRLTKYSAIDEYLSKNWTDTHTLSGKQLLLIPEKTEFFEKFLKDNGYILQTRPPKKEHAPKPISESNYTNSNVGGGDVGKDKGIDDDNEGGLFFVDKFMKQTNKEIVKTIKKEDEKEYIIPTELTEEQSKNLKKDLTSNILDIKIMQHISILSAYKKNFSHISIIKEIPIELEPDADVDQNISEKKEYLEKLQEIIRSFQEILFKMLDDFEIEYNIFDIMDEKSTNKFFSMCIDEYKLRKKILELDKKLISHGLEECEVYSEEEFLKKEKELATVT